MSDKPHEIVSLSGPAESPVAKFESKQNPSAFAVNGIFILAILTVLYFARDLILPIVAAFMLSLVFMPVVRGMKKIFIPAPVGAGIVVLVLIAVFIGGVYRLAGPAGVWLEKAPQSLRKIDIKLRRFSGSVQEVATATEQVRVMTDKISGNNENAQKVQKVVMQEPSFADTFIAGVRNFGINAVSTLTLLYFLLASGEFFLRRTITTSARFSDKKRAIEIAHHVESSVSRYLLTVTMINIALGSAVALAMHLLHVPNPLLWGAMVGLLNYIPYIGDIVSITVLSIVGLLTFDSALQALLVPGVFYLLTAIEGYLVTPMVVGKRMSLSPVIIVISVMFWGWMWGILGALLAVPILVVLKTVTDRMESLQFFRS